MKYESLRKKGVKPKLAAKIARDRKTPKRAKRKRTKR